MGLPGKMAFLLIIGALLGCTPPAENLLKKGSAGLGSDNLNASFADLRREPATDLSRLDTQSRIIMESYGSTIKSYARKYGFDWRLILALMKQESGFIPQAESERGASGLMQMMPYTREEVGKVLEIEDMAHPMNNIRGGIFYLSKLYDIFEGADEGDRIRLTLAAYNAGPARIYDAQDVAAYFRDNPRRWQSVRDALPLLSKRYYTLHRNVWADEHPRAGCFGEARQTIAYVNKVMDYYEGYRQAMIQ
jgi:membrane-bound lytic murein transglycosylase MltF